MASITTALVIIVAGTTYMTFSSNSPVNSAKIARLVSGRDELKTSIENYIYSTNAKSVITTFSNEEILCGLSDENSSAYGIVDMESTYEYEGETLYKLDSDKCKEKLGMDLSKISFKGGSWYIDLDGNPYLVFENYENMESYLKNNTQGGTTLSEIIKY